MKSCRIHMQIGLLYQEKRKRQGIEANRLNELKELLLQDHRPGIQPEITNSPLRK